MNDDLRTGFRQWFEDCLRRLHGRRLEWPQLLRYALREKMAGVAASGIFYKGEVFKDRDEETGKVGDHSGDSEKMLVRRLYRLVHEQGGLLHVGSEEIWLIGWEIPNQGNEDSNAAKARRIDLLGLRRNGSLVVFECKAGRNTGDTPLFAFLEGLDYLGCLLSSRNMEKLKKGFRAWRDKDRSHATGFVSSVPANFADLEIHDDGPHAVIVLAPASYYKHHEFDSHGIPQGWMYLSDRCWEGSAAASTGLHLDFAITDFAVPSCELLTVPK